MQLNLNLSAAGMVALILACLALFANQGKAFVDSVWFASSGCSVIESPPAAKAIKAKGAK